MQNFVGKTKCIVGYMKVANVAETPNSSIKDHELLLPIIPFGFVAYGFLETAV